MNQADEIKRKIVADEVIRRFTRLYGPPPTNDSDAFEEEYFKALIGADRDVLVSAMDELVKRQTLPAWPVVGACVEAVNYAAECRANERRRMEPKQETEDYRKPTPEERGRVRELLAGLKEKLSANNAVRAIPPREDWSRSTKPAWDERMETSETAQQLSLPRTLRRR